MARSVEVPHPGAREGFGPLHVLKVQRGCHAGWLCGAARTESAERWPWGDEERARDGADERR